MSHCRAGGRRCCRRSGCRPSCRVRSCLPRSFASPTQSRDPRSRPLRIVSDYFAKPPATGDERRADTARRLCLALADPCQRARGRPESSRRDPRKPPRLAARATGSWASTPKRSRPSAATPHSCGACTSSMPPTFAAFSPTLRVRNGVLVLPGGPDLQPLWQSLVQTPLTNPRDAIPELLGRDDGRLASFVEAIEGLDAAHMRLVRDDAGRDEQETASTRKSTDEIAKEKAEKRAAAFKALYQTFVDVEPAWKTSEFPFLRLSADPALLLAMAPLGPDGHVFGTVAYWRAVVGSDDLPDSRAAPDDLRDSDRDHIAGAPAARDAVVAACTPGDARLGGVHGTAGDAVSRLDVGRPCLHDACVAPLPRSDSDPRTCGYSRLADLDGARATRDAISIRLPTIRASTRRWPCSRRRSC